MSWDYKRFEHLDVSDTESELVFENFDHKQQPLRLIIRFMSDQQIRMRFIQTAKQNTVHTGPAFLFGVSDACTQQTKIKTHDAARCAPTVETELTNLW